MGRKNSEIFVVEVHKFSTAPSQVYENDRDRDVLLCEKGGKGVACAERGKKGRKGGGEVGLVVSLDVSTCCVHVGFPCREEDSVYT